MCLLQTQRLRFDFNLPRGMKAEEVQQAEGLVNSWIQQDHALSTHVVPLQEAKDKGQPVGMQLQLYLCCFVVWQVFDLCRGCRTKDVRTSCQAHVPLPQKLHSLCVTLCI